MPTTLNFRTTLVADDVERIRAIVVAAQNFSSAEIEIAAELPTERLARGDASGYYFILADEPPARDSAAATTALAGYACYGPIPGTVARYDVYWVVVGPSTQRRGLGRELLLRTEAAIRAAGGERIYIDTSTSSGYDAARGFYRRMGYTVAAELSDFYQDGDGKVIFLKVLSP